jgi:putative flippase GtrA
MNELVIKIVKFGIVGFSGVLVDFAITWLLKEQLKWSKYLANSLGFLCAASNNYIFNRLWTFQDSNPEVWWQYGKFMLISVVGLGLNNAVVWVAHERRNFNFYVAKVLAVFVVMFWNFIANYYYTFT